MFKDNHSRRAFLAGAGAAISSAALAAESDPELIVFNARVYTVDTAQPKAQAFAVRGGKFIAIGANDAIKALAGRGTISMDAAGQTVVPGFIDCHNHAPGNILLYEVLVGNPFVVEFVTIQSIVDKLKARAAKTPPGTWVEGYFFDDTKVKENRQLDVHDLDKVSSEHPVVVHHRGGHTSYYNSKALTMAGLTRSTPDAFGGT